MERYRPKLWRLLCCHLPVQIVCRTNIDTSAPIFPDLAYSHSTSNSSPGSLKEAFICGGLPPLVNDPDPVYARTYGKHLCLWNVSTLTNQLIEKVDQRNQAYYAKFPEDVERVKKIMQYLTANQVALPSGWLTPARFQQLGIVFGFHGKYP